MDIDQHISLGPSCAHHGWFTIHGIHGMLRLIYVKTCLKTMFVVTKHVNGIARINVEDLVIICNQNTGPYTNMIQSQQKTQG